MTLETYYDLWMCTHVSITWRNNAPFEKECASLLRYAFNLRIYVAENAIWAMHRKQSMNLNVYGGS